VKPRPRLRRASRGSTSVSALRSPTHLARSCCTYDIQLETRHGYLLPITTREAIAAVRFRPYFCDETSEGGPIAEVARSMGRDDELHLRGGADGRSPDF
jgi:hypothetical protein